LGQSHNGVPLAQPGLTNKAGMSLEIIEMASPDHPYCGLPAKEGGDPSKGSGLQGGQRSLEVRNVTGTSDKISVTRITNGGDRDYSGLFQRPLASHHGREGDENERSRTLPVPKTERFYEKATDSPCSRDRFISTGKTIRFR
jgi:hypothetical protein